ncbi:MAG: hypothetical protein AB7Q42_23405 [Acidimicrobiia bacterium]
MKRSIGWTVLAVLAGIGISACSEGSTEAADEGPAAIVEEVAGTELHRLTLTDRAAQRLDIQTATVAEDASAGAATRTIPYSALVYTADGNTWTYTNPEALVFVRQAVTVDHITGDVAFLSDGPEPGTVVVSVGVAELYGTELGVGGDGH